MAASGVDAFRQLSQSVKSGSEPISSAVAKLDNIDFSLFNIDQMALVEDANWIPDDRAVGIMKSWIRRQDEVLMQIRAYLVLVPHVTPGIMQKIITAARQPSYIDASNEFEVTNIFQRLVTANDTRPPINIIDAKLIEFARSDIAQGSKDANLFDQDPQTFFQSQPGPGKWFRVSLPRFLVMSPRSYVLKAPPGGGGTQMKGGLREWRLEGAKELKGDATVWSTLDQQEGDVKLRDGSSEAVYSVLPEAASGWYQHFRLTNRGNTHQGNLQMKVAKFDLSGRVKLVKEG